MRKHLMQEGTQSESGDHLFSIVRNKIHLALDEMEIVGPLLRINAADVRRIVMTAAAQAVADRLYDDGFSDRDAAAFIVDRMAVSAEADGEGREEEEEEEQEGRDDDRRRDRGVD
jgi:hypothetical protein